MGQPSKRRIQIMLADDHPMLRRGLRSALGMDEDIEIIGEVGSFPELISALDQATPDVVLLDLGGMGTPPITAVSVLKRTHPRLSIIIYSSSLTGVMELLKIGAQGFIAKEDCEDEVVNAIHTVTRRQIFLSPAVNEYLERSGLARQQHNLMPKEWEVLRLVAEGYSTQDIMAHLSIAEQTVRNYIYALFRKTGCTERTQLAEWYRHFSEPQAKLATET